MGRVTNPEENMNGVSRREAIAFKPVNLHAGYNVMSLVVDSAALCLNPSDRGPLGQKSSLFCPRANGGNKPKYQGEVGAFIIIGILN